MTIDQAARVATIELCRSAATLMDSANIIARHMTALVAERDQQLSAIGSLLDEAGIPDGGSTVTRVAMLVAARDEAVKLISDQIEQEQRDG